MPVQQLKGRTVWFTQKTPAWNVNFQLILGDRHNFVVDTGVGSQSMEPVKEWIANHPKPLVVVNTHHDWDHVWGNGALPATVIVAHKLCGEYLSENWDKILQENAQHALGTVVKSLPTLVFDREIYFPEDGVRIFHTPGHTADSISVLDEKDGILNVGDNIGMTKEAILPYLHCGKEVYRPTLALYQSLGFDTVLSGHNVALGREVFDEIELKLYAE
jgi:glyoxylase-like metal-dependent hydrolase (beta-lactamase superfamily II)